MRSASPSKCYLPHLAVELLEHIAYYAASPLGPPASLLSLQLTCKSIYAALAFDIKKPYLYDRIFRLKFDLNAPRRRLGDEIFDSFTLAGELRRRCNLLQRIRRRTVTGPCVREDLWLAYLMLLESDGRNEWQLIEWAGLRNYAITFLVQSLAGGRDSSGWLIESEENALAVWLLWMSSTEETLRGESQEVHSLILRILQPFVIAPFKYQAAFIPDTHFALPLVGSPDSNPPRCISTPHGQYPVYRKPIPAHWPTFIHFGQPLTLAAPPLTPAAVLCIHACRQLGYMQPPASLPRRRSDLHSHEDGLTLEDYVEVNTKVRTRCVRRALSSGSQDLSVPPFVENTDSNVGDESAYMDVDAGEVVVYPVEQTCVGTYSLSWQHEHDWLRIARCYNPWLDAKIKIRIYTPGMLSGLWAGRMFAYDARQYMHLSQEQMAPAALFAPGAEDYPGAYQIPIYMRLREHHCLSECLPIGWGQGVYDREADGLSNAYFPPGTEFYENKEAGFVRLFDPNSEEILTYETYKPDQWNSHIASGGCQHCRPDAGIDTTKASRPSFALTHEQRREAEQIFSAEGLGDNEDPWEDSVENGCIHDIIVTGETDSDHARAWGSYKFTGRVRDLDGFIVLLRIPTEPNTRGAGTYIFRGYIHSNQNFVGRWRAASDPPDAFTAVEGNFSLCKWE